MPRLKRDATPSQAPATRWTAPRAPRARHGSVSEAPQTIPSHLWCWLARHGDIVDFGAVLQCSASLFSAAEADALWHYHAFTCGFARPVFRPGLDWIYPFMPEVLVDQCIDWQRFVQMSCETRNSPSIWVRVRDIDLRMPLPPPSTQNPMGAVSAQLNKLLCIRPMLFQQRLGTVRTPEPHEFEDMRESVLRLRLLQWAGRPGPVLFGNVMAGDHLLLEWSLPSERGWPLPPHALPVQPAASSTRTRSAWSPGRRLFSGSTLFASWRRTLDSSASSSAPAEPPSHQLRSVLVRVTSAPHRGSPPLIHGDFWGLLDLSTATLGTLYETITKAIKQGPCHDQLSGPFQFHIMDNYQLKKKLPGADTRQHAPRRGASWPLRELCWTHSETVNVELDVESRHLPSQVILVWREQELVRHHSGGGERSQAQRTQASKPAPSKTPSITSPLAALPAIANASAMVVPPPPPPEIPGIQRPPMWWEHEEPNYQLASSCCASGAASNATAAARASNSQDRDDLNSDIASPGPRRQVSEGAESVASSRGLPQTFRFGRQLSEGSNGPQGSSRGSVMLQAGHPGDTAVDGDLDQEIATSWERLAPHYPPKLLVNTHQTRQFEFHPSLPQVLLTGDKKGGVNVISTDEETVRRPLIVDSCPVLGLGWMRHHPQSAVCGAAHSGKIRFLKYDAQANPSEPALQHVLTVDEFPKLSSLSINCTDDFLLASGFTHDLAIYDTQTGMVLHRVLGVHSHFINISRFAHRSPHIFATASFDHSCKVWDIRQPLMHDKPVKVLQTGSLNVMCTFSPDDKYLLCSGIDTRITQFELPSFRQVPDEFPLRPAMHQARYRRSMYFESGRHFVTAATDESHIRVMSARGHNLGVVDFCGLLGRSAPSITRPLPPGELPLSPCLPRRRSRLIDSSCCKLQRAEGREVPRLMWEASPLVSGEVHLADEQASSAETARHHKEYVQSVRTHPIVDNCVGVLLSSYHPDPQSYIAFVHLDPNLGRDIG